MKKAYSIVAIFCIAGYLYDNFFTQDMIAGTYVNRNYENDFLPDNPHVADTLIILKNNMFISPYWSKGYYELYYTGKGTRISLNYEDRFGGSGFDTSIDRIMYFGNLK